MHKNYKRYYMSANHALFNLKNPNTDFLAAGIGDGEEKPKNKNKKGKDNEQK